MTRGYTERTATSGSPVNIFAIVISLAALVFASAAFYRTSAKPETAAPTVTPKGAGGGGW